uniref:Reverse transcriptase domain-containing protein n=1 Tax=Tanacetum cinerariifolium TaxID=118510 RepID=A0A6L2J9W8_TANCI|nr:reverse transcriptase domain-containing protein [Tanacetum cinerariifolium]
MMEEMLQAPMEGYGDAIVVPDILAENFEIRTGLLSLIQANQFYGFKSNNPNDHIRSFNRITSTLNFRDVPNDAIKLMLFPYSLEGAAKIWYEKEQPRSILTWGDLTMSSLNVAAGRNLLRKTPQDALIIIENKSKVRYSQNKPIAFKVSTTSNGTSSSTDARIDKLTDTISNLVETFNKKMTTLAMVKAVEETCVICEGAHPYYDCIATDSNISRVCVTTGTYNQGSTGFRPQVATNYRASPPDFPPVQNTQNRYNQTQNQSYNQSRGNKYQAPIQHPQVELTNEFSKYKQITETSIRVMQNQIYNFKAGLKNEIHSSMQNQMNIIRVRVCFQATPFPTLGQILKLSPLGVVFLKLDPRFFLLFLRRTGRALIDVYGKELTVRVDDEAITFKVGQTSKYSYNNAESINQIDVIDVPSSDPIISSFSTSFTPFEGSDFILEEIKTFLQTPDELSDLDDDYYDTEGDILYLENFLTEDPSHNLPLVKTGDLKQVDATKTKPSIEEPSDLELKELPSHLEYAFLEGTDKLPVIISKELKNEEKSTLLKVLKSHKRAIAPWFSPVHCVPKKGGITVVENEDNELIPTSKMLSCGCSGGYSYFKNLMLLFEIKKGAKNLTADHLSRLENPYQDELEKKEITETFPLETLERAGSPRSTLPTNDARVVLKILKSLFARFGTPRAIIIDRGTHFCNEQFAKAMLEYGVTHHLFTMYHPQTSRQMEVSNRGFKRILVRTIGENRASWSDKLDDAYGLFVLPSRHPLGAPLISWYTEKACHLPIELEHKAYWALKHCNFDLKTAGGHRKVQLNELNELRDRDYENSLIYKEKTKKIHDSKIKNRVFNVGDRVLLFNSRLNIFSRKLKTRWTGPFTVAHVFPYGTIKLSQADGPNFKVNVHRLKHYFRGDIQNWLIAPDLEASRARGFIHRPLELQSLAYGNPIS